MTAAGIVQILVIGFIDYLTGYEISFSIFYLLPIAFITWYVSRNMGIAFSIIGAIIWIKVDLMTEHPYSHFAIPYWNAMVRMGFFLTVCIILSRLKTSYAMEKTLAKTDSLTGIANSREFYYWATQEIYKANRHDRPITAAYFDIDNFKFINDNLGHNIGDALLKVVAQTVKNNIRLTDVSARLGGDEFALLLPETNAESSRIIIHKLNELLLKAVKENKWQVTFSFGVVTFISAPRSVDEMIKAVDTVMYDAKKKGKNLIKYEVFERRDDRKNEG